jgi:peptide/nickel transport system permease protein
MPPQGKPEDTSRQQTCQVINGSKNGLLLKTSYLETAGLRARPEVQGTGPAKGLIYRSGAGYMVKSKHGIEAMKRYFRNLNFTVGFVLSVTVVLMAVVCLVWTPYAPNKMHPRERLQGPSPAHPLGTDQYGRDTLSRVMVGSVNSIIVGLVTVAMGLSLGVALGLVSAYFGGWTDEGIMRLSDLLFGFPAVLTAILITSILGPSMINAMLAIGIFYIPIFARLTRAVARSVWEREYITAARASGVGELGIVWRHVLPNILSPLLIQATIQFAVAILAEAGLSYLGLGTQPPHASWGRMLNEAQTFMATNPSMAVFPGLAIAWAVLGFNLLGDGLRDTLDPRMVRVR